jgi:hypothetical protein
MSLIYPNFNEFSGHINVYADNVLGILKCHTCGATITVSLKGKTSDYTDEELKFKILRKAQKEHNCLAKQNLWFDKSVLKKNFPDYVEGYEKLQEQEEKEKKWGINASSK